MDDFRDDREPAVAKSRALQQGLERAVITVMTEFDAGHVEGDGVGGQLFGRGKDELRPRVEEALDEPRRRQAVHVRPGTGGPTAAVEGLEVEPARRRAGLGRSRHAALRGFPGPQRLLAPRCVEEVDVGQAVELARQPRQLFRRARPPARAELPVAVGEDRIVGVACLVKETDHLRLLHVLDAVDLEKGRLAPVLLNLLRQPLELLVSVRRERQKVGAALERDGAERPQPAPSADAEARGARRQAQQEKDPWLKHVFRTYNT